MLFRSQPGDPVFDQYYAHLAPAIADQDLQEDLTGAALIALLERIDNDDPTALVGLPLIRTCRLLRQAGLPVW